jgi:hypothetical protein
MKESLQGIPQMILVSERRKGPEAEDRILD